MRRKGRYGTWRLLFAAMVVGGVVLFLSVSSAHESSPSAAPGGGGDSEAGWVVAAAIATPIIGILGLVSTTFFAWRQDRRDLQQSELQMQKLNLQIAQLQSTTDRRATAVDEQAAAATPEPNQTQEGIAGNDGDTRVS
jgi:outer membrane murein-binding lipoprotein Lpp